MERGRARIGERKICIDWRCYLDSEHQQALAALRFRSSASVAHPAKQLNSCKRPPSALPQVQPMSHQQLLPPQLPARHYNHPPNTFVDFKFCIAFLPRPNLKCVEVWHSYSCVAFFGLRYAVMIHDVEDCWLFGIWIRFHSCTNSSCT